MKILNRREWDYILRYYSHMHNDDDFYTTGEALKYNWDYCLLEGEPAYLARMVCFLERIWRWPTLEDMEKE